MNRAVLIIDDDSFALYINQEVIEPLVISPVRTYLEAKQALLFLQEHLSEETSFLVFLDLNMPEMNGWQFLDKLIKSNFKSNIAVVIVTSSVDEKDLARALNYCCVRGFIVKPIEEKVVAALASVDQLSAFFN